MNELLSGESENVLLLNVSDGKGLQITPMLGPFNFSDFELIRTERHLL